MKKFFFIFTLIYIQCLSQEQVKVSHVSQHDNFIEVGIHIDKPTDKFNLIRLDTLTVTGNQKNILKENKEYPLNYGYNNGRTLIRRYDIPEKHSKNVTIKGVIQYFTPSKGNGSYIDAGKLKNIKLNTNLVSKAAVDKNPKLYFSIIDSATVNKVFPDLKVNNEKIDFKSYDIMYAYKDSSPQKLTYFINDSPDPGYNNMILEDSKTGVIYKLVKLKQNMSPSERDQFHVELMIENENAVRKIPFELKDIAVVEK
ncbi:hypothetical protein [Chryseobacterium sp.]|uniref:hypothetical protein n=1 Tax=Chryseobacterium sp. TaxID=1871047 RepID=UPI00289A84A4|nr:hypothetical protein [Chryseobacterium sp.]